MGSNPSHVIDVSEEDGVFLVRGQRAVVDDLLLRQIASNNKPSGGSLASSAQHAHL